jgi:O-antigen/teichoic acid export membrane protein
MASQSRTGNSIRNIATGLGGYFLNTLLGFITRTVFIKCLAADYLGINGLFTNILTMLSLAELGVGTAIVYALYKPLATDDKDKVASLMQFYGRAYRVIGIAVAVFGLCMMPFLKIVIPEVPHIKESLYLIYSIYLFNTVSSYFFSFRSALITASQQYYIVNGLSYLVTIVTSLVQIPLLLITREYLPFLLVQAASTLIYYVLLSKIAKKKFPYIASKDIQPLEKEEKKSIIKNVRALMVTQLSGVLVNNTDNIIITYFKGLATVGYLSNYLLLTGTLNTLLTQAFSGITASVGNYNALETREKKLELFHFINLANFWLFGWAAIGIAVMSNDIIKLWVGSDYLLPVSIPWVIALNFYLVGMQSAVWTYKSTLGLFKYGRYLLLITAALNLGLSLYLGNKWGLFGILFATTIARVVTNVWYDPYAVFKYGLKEPPLKYFGRYLMYAVVLFSTAGLCFFLCDLVKFSVVWNVVVKFIICCTVPNLIFLFVFHKRTEFNYFLTLLRRLAEKTIKRVSK